MGGQRTIDGKFLVPYEYRGASGVCAIGLINPSSCSSKPRQSFRS